MIGRFQRKVGIEDLSEQFCSPPTKQNSNTHEINEAFIGGNIDPGGNYDSGYEKSHAVADGLDKVEGDITVKQNKITNKVSAYHNSKNKSVIIYGY